MSRTQVTVFLDEYTFRGENGGNADRLDLSEAESVRIAVTDAGLGRSWTQKMCTLFLILFQNASKLRSISFDGPLCRDGWHAPVVDVASLIPFIAATGSGCTRVRHISLSTIKLRGTEIAWEKMRSCIRSHFSTIEEVDMSRLDIGETYSPCSFESLIQPIYSMSLQALRIDCKPLDAEPTLYILPATLHSLAFMCPNLVDLKISNMEMEDGHISALSAAFSTRLEILVCEVSNSLWNPMYCASKLADLLERSKRLESFQVHGAFSVEAEIREKILLLFINGMSSNSSIKEFTWVGYWYFGRSSLSPAVREDLVSMIRNNATLQFFSMDYRVPNEFEFYLGLNWAGRRQLMGQDRLATSGQWLETMIRARERFNGEEDKVLSALFYFLSCNPGLCNPPNERAPVVANWIHGRRRGIKRSHAEFNCS
jgi:hypothetical protein